MNFLSLIGEGTFENGVTFFDDLGQHRCGSLTKTKLADKTNPLK
jgi:hypothetical protein